MRRPTTLNEENLIETQELALASTLVCLGFPIFEIRKVDSKKVVFTFENDNDVVSTIEGFWKDTLVCSPKKYFYTLKELKSRIYSFRNSIEYMKGGDTQK